MTPASRLSLLKSKGYCFQCLFPGAASASGKHKDGKCQHDFVCPDESHQKYSVRKHVLVCEEHKEEPANVELLEKFKERFFRNPDLPSFTKNISLSFHTESFQTVDEDGDRGIYMLQEIQINQNKLLIFFDNGCSDFVVSQKAIKLLGSNAIKASSKPVILGGVGNSITKSTLGRYIVKLPLSNGEMVSFTGPCIPKITSTFPTFSLIEAHKDIDESYSKAGGLKPLPKLPRSIGGDVHMMIGVKHLKYFPKHVYQMPSGLTILESLFTSSSGGRGVIAGPHPSFRCFNVSSNFTSVYHNTIHPIKTPLLGFNADHPTSLKYFTQSKEDQSNQSININDQKEHPIDSPIEIPSKTRSIKSTQSPITDSSNHMNIAIKVDQMPHKLNINESSNQNEKNSIKASVMSQIPNFNQSNQIIPNDQIVKSLSSSPATSNEITSNLYHVIGSFIQRRSSISKAFKLTNSTVSLSQSAIWIPIINRLSTNLSVLYPFQMDFSCLHDSHLSSFTKSTLEKFQLICCYFLTSSVIDQTSINEIVKYSSLVVINSFYDPD